MEICQDSSLKLKDWFSVNNDEAHELHLIKIQVNSSCDYSKLQS
jgi:hypothetical protein